MRIPASRIQLTGIAWTVVLSILLVGYSRVSAQVTDRWTPVVVRAMQERTTPFPATDGKTHVVYELEVLNSKSTAATLESLEVLDTKNAERSLASYEGATLQALLRTPDGKPVKSLAIPPYETRLVLLHLEFAGSRDVPARLAHRFELIAAPSPAPVPAASMSYTLAPITLGGRLPTLGRPLAGEGWVAVNGCCAAGSAHRGSVQGDNGKLYFAQRFAIDWIRIGKDGRWLGGDPKDVKSYAAYGADVLAVADATVIGVLDELPDQDPGTLPDPATITLETVDGNHIVLDLGGGFYANYAHLARGSVRVKVGDRVKRGQVMAKLGNSGNTSAPHLHFHVSDSASVLGTQGVPYVLDQFALAGQAPTDESFDPGSDYRPYLTSRPTAERSRFPMDMNVVDFGP